MASETEICNLALSHIGVGKEIASLTENSQEARTCNRYYKVSREAVLRDFAWPFATKVIALALVEENPNDEWDFSYRYPADCLRFIKIPSGLRNDTRQSRTPYKIIGDDSGRLILTDKDLACSEYVRKITDEALFPPDFEMAFSYRLAASIAPRLTGGDPFKMKEYALQMYAFEISSAKSASKNEEQNEELPESEFIRARA